MLEELKKYFIYDDIPFEEGAVSVFEQTVYSDEDRDEILYITALGVFEAELNGEKAGDELFAPGFTYYPHNLQACEYNVHLNAGSNVLRVYLGQGWYCGRFTFDNKVQIYGDQPAVSWILGDVNSRSEGVRLMESPYDYAGEYDGEIYYGNEHKAVSRQPVPYTGALPEDITKRECAVRVREEMPVREVTEHDDVTILDFGQNFAGVICIDPAKMKGSHLKLRHGEILNEDGTLYTANLRKAKASIEYYRGSDESVYHPRFTYMGFRYAELTGVPYEEGLIKAYAVYSDMERTGYFHCDNENVQKLYENQVWGQKSNYVEVPTDCPQRDERMGYTGDGHVFARSGAYNFDTRKFWKKFLADIRYSQLDNKKGYIPSTAPTPSKDLQGIGFLSMLGWGNMVTIVPDMLYWQYGDDSFEKEQYESIRRFVDCECRKCSPLGLWIGPSLGDWLALGKDVKYMAMHNGPVSNSFIVNDLKIASGLAEDLGRSEDAAKWKKQLEKTRKAYIKHYVQKDGTMKDDYQGAYVMALQFVIPAESELYRKVYAKLVEKIKAEGMQTGFFATEHILPLLVKNGDAKLAYDLLLQPKCPGWMYQINRGATTTWERWDALRLDGSVNETKMSDDNMVSFNHYAFGSVAEFYYRNILGIEPLEPGFRKVKIAPQFDERLGHVSGSYKSISGTVCVDWEKAGDAFVLNIDTPQETLIVLPDGSSRNAEPGKHTFSYKTGEQNEKI